MALFSPVRNSRKIHVPTWRTIPVSKWLGSPPFISHEKAEGKQAYLGDYHHKVGPIPLISMVISPLIGVITPVTQL